jgi:cyclopropane-fatty-acyl-phospholipid synthase
LIESQRNHIESCPDERIEVSLGSWRDYAPTQPFDAIICMGAFEGVAARDQSPIERAMAYRKFFERCHAWLKPGGRLSLQSIHVNGGAQDLGLLFRQYVFPHSDLPRLAEIVTAVEQLFEIRTLRESRREVALACKNASQRLQWGGDDQSLARMGRCLQYLSNGFDTGSLGLVRMSLRRLG